MSTAVLCLVLLLGISLPALADIVPGPQLFTPWTNLVSPSAPLPEYPRPQMKREAWANLNGKWDFASGGNFSSPPFQASFEEQILVPFPVESYLSGLKRAESHMWYRKSFTLPSNWSSSRVLLHFGAVDFQCTVWVDQQNLGTHYGGYDSFFFDITSAAQGAPGGWGGAHQIVLEVYDPTDTTPTNPMGKQTVHPASIFYTSTSGVWRTVWLEPVPAAHIERVDLIPDVDAGRVLVFVAGSSAANGTTVTVEVHDDNATIARGSGAVGNAFYVGIPSPKLWWPNNPHLYGASVALQGTSGNDSVKCYFGMRKVSVASDSNDRKRVLINNRFLFQSGVLDQGFWPDGVYTAATDEALQYDIALAKRLGYNMIRKHLKVEPDRWYYHADRLGMMVWQDMPAMCGPINYPNPGGRCNIVRAWQTGDEYQFVKENRAHIIQHMSFPSIIGYVIFNEAGGQYSPDSAMNQQYTQAVVRAAAQVDPSRLYDPASGWIDSPIGNVTDVHNYSANPVGNGGWTVVNRASLVGEYGGQQLSKPGHDYTQDSFGGYTVNTDPDTMLDALLEQTASLRGTITSPDKALSGAVYTEISDVEGELNGLVTYDRQVVKLDAGSLQNMNAAFYRQAEGVTIGPASS